MPDVFIYADETGDLDFSGNPAVSRYFGIGTAVFEGDHGDALAQGLRLRCELEAAGISMRQGFHAKNDSRRTRHEVFSLIDRQAPRFDVTLLDKAQATPRVRNSTPTYRYKLAVYLHLKWLIPRVAPAWGTAYVILGSLQTAGKREAVREAIEDVCAQVDAPWARIVPCIWDAPSSWGIQVADYGLWAVQREREQDDATWLDTYVRSHLKSCFLPFDGRARRG